MLSWACLIAPGSSLWCLNSQYNCLFLLPFSLPLILFQQHWSNAVPPRSKHVKNPSTSWRTYMSLGMMFVAQKFLSSLKCHLKWYTHWPPIAVPPTPPQSTQLFPWFTFLMHLPQPTCQFAHVSTYWLSSSSHLGCRLHESRNHI